MLTHNKFNGHARAVLVAGCAAGAYLLEEPPTHYTTLHYSYAYLLEEHDMQGAGVVLLGLHHSLKVERSRNLHITPSNRRMP